MYLREDEPHPVGTLLSGNKLGTDLREAGCLSMHEALQMVRIAGFEIRLSHDCVSFPTGR
jgi:hypothetical protein